MTVDGGGKAEKSLVDRVFEKHGKRLRNVASILGMRTSEAPGSSAETSAAKANQASVSYATHGPLISEPPSVIKSRHALSRHAIAAGNSRKIFSLIANDSLVVAIPRTADARQRLQPSAETLQALKAKGFPVVQVHGVIPVEDLTGLLMDRIPGAVSGRRGLRELMTVVNDNTGTSVDHIRQLLTQHRLQIEGLNVCIAGDGHVFISNAWGLQQHDNLSTENDHLLQWLKALSDYVPVGAGTSFHYYAARYGNNELIAVSGKPVEEIHVQLRALENLRHKDFPVLNTKAEVRAIRGEHGISMDRIPGAVSSRSSTRALLCVLNERSAHDLLHTRDRFVVTHAHVEKLKFLFAEDGSAVMGMPADMRIGEAISSENLKEVDRLLTLCNYTRDYKLVAAGQTTKYFSLINNSNVLVAMAGRPRNELEAQVEAVRNLQDLGFPMVSAHGVVDVEDESAILMDRIPGALSSKDPQFADRLNEKSLADLRKLEQVMEGFHVHTDKLLLANDGSVFISSPSGITRANTARTEESSNEIAYFKFKASQNVARLRIEELAAMRR